jgi:hypothetical protein
MVYVPGRAVVGTVNDTTGINCPGVPEPLAPILHAVVGEPMIANGVLVIVHVPSVGLKPLPVTETRAPSLAAVGVSVILGVNRLTTNMAVPKSPLLPRTFTTYVPDVAAAATVKPVPVN